MAKSRNKKRFHLNSKNFCLFIHDSENSNLEYLEYFKNKKFLFKFDKTMYHESPNYISVCSNGNTKEIMLQFSKKVQVTNRLFFKVVLKGRIFNVQCDTVKNSDEFKMESEQRDDFVEHGNYTSNSQKIVQKLRFSNKETKEQEIQNENIDNIVNNYFTYDYSNTHANGNDIPVSEFINEKLRAKNENDV